MARQSSIAPWHQPSYQQFLHKRLPELLTRRLPIETYNVVEQDCDNCTIQITMLSDGNHIEYSVEDIPVPDQDGVFHVNDTETIVIPLVSDEDLETAEIRCVGEQVYDYIDPRLKEAPSGIGWTPELLSSWLPLRKWVIEFLGHDRDFNPSVTTVYPVDNTNSLARVETLRRLIVDVPVGSQTTIGEGRLGRVCPIMMPEGPNIGRVLHVAKGAKIVRGRLVMEDNSPEAHLSITASNIPFLEHNDTNRSLMGANMMRQWIRISEPEAALVQTGNELADPGFWCGRNLLTAFMSWGPGTTEDGIVISQSCAGKLHIPDGIAIGDKLSNRHGTKGVIAQILPDSEMPQLADGTPVELVFSFIGQHTRMNWGQIMEAVVGRVAHEKGAAVFVPPFHAPSRQGIKKMLADNGLPETGMEFLRDGKTGEDLELPSTVGWVYWGVTHHLAKNKLRVCTGGSDGSHYLGQRVGEMEYWALRDIGAYGLIQELLNTLSTEREGVAGLIGELSERDVTPCPAPSPLFLKLQKMLAVGGVQMAYAGENVTFSYAEPTEDALVLNAPVKHPWIRDRSLSAIGAVPELPEYGSVVEANQQLARVLQSNAPAMLAERSVRSLTNQVDALFSALLRTCGHEGPTFFIPKTTPGAPAKVLQHLGQTGRIVIAGRCVFSGRNVIVPAIGLKHDQVGLPLDVAWKFFRPHLLRDGVDQDEIDNRSKGAEAKLVKIMNESWLVLNRAPTLGPSSFLAFHPVLVSGHAIHFNPLACVMLNADFDGDQIAFYLPITEEGQKEAGEKLSLCAHLSRDPGLLDWMRPPMESLWGLAWGALTPDGRGKIEKVAGLDLVGNDGIICRNSLVRALMGQLKNDGAETVLKIIDQLTRMGYEIARRSGASVNPFAGTSLPNYDGDAKANIENYATFLDDLKDVIASRTDYQSPELGPQLLAIKCGARGTENNLVVSMAGAVITNINDQLVATPRGLLDGLEPGELFVRTNGALKGLASISLGSLRIGVERRNASHPKGYNILSRALRSPNAGPVLGRAAITNETDPLKAIDAKLFVGLKP